MNTPVARTIDVHIQPPGTSGPRPARMNPPRAEAPKGPPIAPVAVPPDRMDTARFLARALPGHAIEHLGRASMVAVYGRPGTREASWAEQGEAPTSLFFLSLALCFNEHYPLALRPEVIGQLINHEVAETVKRHPDHYRGLYTKNVTGKELITVRDDTLVPGRPSDWGRALTLFDGALRQRVPDGIMAAMLPAYSTATAESQVASLITFMDAASPFYQYSMLSMCGIPRLRLLGTAADWHLLLSSARQLAKSFAAHLDSYFKHLLPVLTKIADQADPAVPIDNDFWASIYKRASASGGVRVTGWATAFVHYLKNPNGELVLKDPRFADWTQAGASPFDGILHDHFPMHLSTVPFEWEYLGTKRPMKLVGGMLGIEVEDGFVTPMLSYAVVHAVK